MKRTLCQSLVCILPNHPAPPPRQAAFSHNAFLTNRIFCALIRLEATVGFRNLPWHKWLHLKCRQKKCFKLHSLLCISFRVSSGSLLADTSPRQRPLGCDTKKSLTNKKKNKLCAYRPEVRVKKLAVLTCSNSFPDLLRKRSSQAMPDRACGFSHK